MSNAQKVTLVAATHQELSRTVKRLGLRTGAGGYEGTFGGVALRAVVTGVGMQRAETILRHLIENENPHRLILIGFAGALDPALRVGEMPEIRWVKNELGETYEIHDGAVAAVERDAPQQAGHTLLTVDRLIASPKEKSELRSRHGAALVDMESLVTVRLAAEAAAHLSILRAVSDTADTSLPEQAVHWVRPDGRANVAAALRHVIYRPALAACMVRLKRHADRASVALADRVTDLLHRRPIKAPPMSASDVVPATCRSLVIFGGTFDPPHAAHLQLPRQVMAEVAADLVAYIPAALPPLKPDRVMTPPNHRLAMLRLALQDVEHAVILTDEIERARDDEPSYTVDTLEALRRRLGERVRMRLLIGADQLRLFEKWKSPGRIEQLAEPVVMVRPPWTQTTLLATLPDAAARRRWAGRFVDVETIDVSSTEIRRRVAHGESITGMVSVEVEGYIRRHGLYLAVSG